MAEDRLEEVINEAMGNPLTGRIMRKRLEKAYPKLKTDMLLRDKCANFITEPSAETSSQKNEEWRKE
ncbi:MAG: hypothetical protein J6N45_05100, partial [Alphaproteobacteria bacterium]|nr:hypothetical protein [Alphaproteobacteria bacterium]